MAGLPTSPLRSLAQPLSSLSWQLPGQGLWCASPEDGSGRPRGRLNTPACGLSRGAWRTRPSPYPHAAPEKITEVHKVKTKNPVKTSATQRLTTLKCT